MGEGGVLRLDHGQLLLHVQLVLGGLLLGRHGLLGGGGLLGGRLLGVLAGHDCSWGGFSVWGEVGGKKKREGGYCSGVSVCVLGVARGLVPVWAHDVRPPASPLLGVWWGGLLCSGVGVSGGGKKGSAGLLRCSPRPKVWPREHTPRPW